MVHAIGSIKGTKTRLATLDLMYNDHEEKIL